MTFLFFLACGISEAEARTPTSVPVNVTGSYLHSNCAPAYWPEGNSYGMDHPSTPTVIDLELEGFAPGDLLAMEYSGSVSYYCPGNQFILTFGVVGLFSSSTVVLE